MQASLFEAEMTGAVCAHSHALPLLDGASRVVYYPDFLGIEDAARYFARFSDEIEWAQESISLYGKSHPLPRLTAWYGDPGIAYTYSGLRNEPKRWTSALSELLYDVEQFVGAPFNSVLLNRYRTGSDSLSWHSDDEKELGEQPTIASISLGAPRAFVLREKENHAHKFEVVLEPGSLLVMSGDSQRDYQHAVPKQRGIIRERINLTFRVVGAGATRAES